MKHTIRLDSSWRANAEIITTVAFNVGDKVRYEYNIYKIKEIIRVIENDKLVENIYVCVL